MKAILRRDFLKLTAVIPGVAVLPRKTLDAERPDPLSWAGKVRIIVPRIEVYSSHYQFCADLPFHACSITCGVVPKFKCWNKKEETWSKTYVPEEHGLVALNGMLDVSIGAAGSEMPCLTDFRFTKDMEFWIPVTMEKGSRITIRIKDAIRHLTTYEVHMAISGV